MSMKVAPQMNSQGELIVPQEQAVNQGVPSGPFDDVICLCETPLAIAEDSLLPPTDDTGLVHEIISCGHVLKSTHDLARWSEKTGARRVNGIESLDAVSDLAINLEPNRSGRRPANGSSEAEGGNARRTGRRQTARSDDPTEAVSELFREAGNGNGNRRRGRGQQNQQWKPVEGDVKSEVINCWPVLKSTHDQAQLSEKRGRNAVNQAGASELLDELASNTQQGGQQQGGQQATESTVLHSWPVLKSTHDMATWAEKRGASSVNHESGSQALEEVAQGMQAGGPSGSSLQSGLDTQGGSHVQVDSSQ
jgi:hypothetical protein